MNEYDVYAKKINQLRLEATGDTFRALNAAHQALMMWTLHTAKADAYDAWLVYEELKDVNSGANRSDLERALHGLNVKRNRVRILEGM